MGKGVLFLWLLFWAVGCATAPEAGDPDRLILEADRNQQAGHDTVALALYAQALAVDRARVDAHVGIARIHKTWGNSKRAQAAYALAYRHGDRRSEVLFALGQGHQQAHRLEQAIEMYRAMLETEPDHLPGRLNLSAAYLQNEQPKKALALMQETLKQQAQNQQVHVGLAAAYSAMGQNQKAYDHYTHAGRLGPVDLPLAVNMADAALRSGAYRRAAELLSGMAAVEPSERTYVRLGYARFRLGQSDQALRAYRQAVVINARSTDALNGLGVVLIDRFETGQGQDVRLRDVALRLLDRSIAIDPDQPRVVGLIDRYRQALGPKKQEG